MSFWNPFEVIERIDRRLRLILENERIIIHNQFLSSEKENHMTQVLDNFTVAVENLTAIVATANDLMVALKGLLGPDETVALQAQVDLLNAQIAKLSDGVAQNQPPVVG